MILYTRGMYAFTYNAHSKFYAYIIYRYSQTCAQCARTPSKYEYRYADHRDYTMYTASYVAIIINRLSNEKKKKILRLITCI